METIYKRIKRDGSVVLPKRALSRMGVKVGERVMLTVREKEIRVKPVSKLSEMRGILKGISRKTSREMIEEIRNEDKEFDY